MTQSSLVKIGLPTEQAEGARLARKVRHLLEQRDAAHARVEAAFRASMKSLLEEPTEGPELATASGAEQVSAVQ